MSRTQPSASEIVARRRAEADRLLDQAATWEPFHGPTGTALFRIRGSRGASYVVSARSCTCPDHSVPRAGRPPGPCKHLLAVRRYTRIVQAFRTHVAALAAAPQSIQEVDHDRRATARPA